MRTIQKFIAFLCALALLLCAIPAAALAQDSENAPPFRASWFDAAATNGADGTLEASLVGADETVLATATAQAIDGSGEWRYVEFLLEAPEKPYSAASTTVSPTVAWTGSTGNGTLILNGWCFADEMEVVLLPGEMVGNVQMASGASATRLTDKSRTWSAFPSRLLWLTIK